MTTAFGSVHRLFSLLVLCSAGFLVASCTEDDVESSAFENIHGAEVVGVIGTATGEAIGRVQFATLLPEGKLAFARIDECTIQVHKINGTHAWSHDACRSTIGGIVGLATLGDTVIALYRGSAGLQLEKLWQDTQRGSEAAQLMLPLEPAKSVVGFGESGQRLFVLLRESIDVTPGDIARREERLRYELRELHAGAGALSRAIWTHVDTMFRLTVESRDMSWRLQAPFQLGMRAGIGGPGMFYWAQQRDAFVEALNGDTFRIGPLAPVTTSIVEAEIRADSFRNAEHIEWQRTSLAEIRGFPVQQHLPPVYAILPAADGSVAVQRADRGILGVAAPSDSTVVEIVAADTVTVLVLAPGFRARAFDGRHLVGVVSVASSDDNDREQPVRSIVVIYRLQH